MSILLALASTFGKTAAERLFLALGSRDRGQERLDKALNAMKSGVTVIEALKQAFGKDFLKTLNDVLGTTSAPFTYEAGSQHYIKLEESSLSPARLLRDELNINLDRLTLLEISDNNLRNHARGVISVWGSRCHDLFKNREKVIPVIETTLRTMNELLDGSSRNYHQVYHLLSTTGLQGLGSLMVIAGALLATGTGVGIMTSISTFVFGIPWINVVPLIILGAILMRMSTKKTEPKNEISLTISLAYKLLERLEKSDLLPN